MQQFGVERLQQAAADDGVMQSRSSAQQLVAAGQVAVVGSTAGNREARQLYAGLAVVDSRTEAACSMGRAEGRRHRLVAVAEAAEGAGARRRMEVARRDRTTDACAMGECSPMLQAVMLVRTRAIESWVVG